MSDFGHDGLHLDSSGSFVTPKLDEYIGVQERASGYGEGTTKRVYEIRYGDYSFGVNLGDIAEAPTDSIMLPSTPWLHIGGGAIENAICRELGDEYDSYTDRVRNYLERISFSTDDSEKAEWAQKLSDLFSTVGDTSPENAAVLAAQLGRLSAITELPDASDHIVMLQIGPDGELQPVPTDDNLGVPRESLTLPYGAATPCIPGRLAARGINSVIISNVTPDSSMPGEETGMTGDHMVMFTHNAALVADRTGSGSITVPAVGTGFAAAFGFGMSMQDSITGYFLGAKEFADSGVSQGLRSLDFNIYAQPSEDMARQVAELVQDQGIPDLLAA